MRSSIGVFIHYSCFGEILKTMFRDGAKCGLQQWYVDPLCSEKKKHVGVQPELHSDLNLVV